MEESADWTKHVFEVSIDQYFGPETPMGALGFPVTGGADQGEFLYVGYMPCSQVSYTDYDCRTHKMREGSHMLWEGDIILQTDAWIYAGGLRKREYLGLMERDRYGWRKEYRIIKCINPGHLPIKLQEFLEMASCAGDATFNLQAQIRDNLLKMLPPITTRYPRDDETNSDYTFVNMDEFLVLEKAGKIIQSRMFDGHYYGIQKPAVVEFMPSGIAIEEFRTRPILKRNESFTQALGISPETSFEEDSSGREGSESPQRTEFSTAHHENVIYKRQVKTG